MNDLITFLRNYDYTITLAKGTKWTLDEAVDYLAAYTANGQKWFDRENAYQGFLNIKEQTLTAVQHGIDEGWLLIHDEYKEVGDSDAGTGHGEIDFRKSTVIPFNFIKWAIASNIEVPKQYKEYAAKHKNDKEFYYETLGVKKSCIHHERSRAVAELLWRIDPDVPIAHMARRREIIEIGCEGHEYDLRTISRWLATLKADRTPGRSKKTSSN